MALDAKSEGRVGVDLRVEAHLEEIYGVKVGRDLISKVTDAVMDDARAWAQRPLEDVYPVIFLDAMVLKVREGGSGQRRACYLALGSPSTATATCWACAFKRPRAQNSAAILFRADLGHLAYHLCHRGCLVISSLAPGAPPVIPLGR